MKSVIVAGIGIIIREIGAFVKMVKFLVKFHCTFLGQTFIMMLKTVNYN